MSDSIIKPRLNFTQLFTRGDGRDDAGRTSLSDDRTGSTGVEFFKRARTSFIYAPTQGGSSQPTIRPKPNQPTTHIETDTQGTTAHAKTITAERQCHSVFLFFAPKKHTT
jgi:hypothetical protein